MSSAGRLPALLLAAAACAGGEGSMPPGETAAERCRAFVEDGLALDSLTRTGLRAQLGEPQRVEATTEPNRHIPDAVDSLFTMVWPGATVLMRMPPAGNDLVEQIALTDGRWLRWQTPGIGAAEARVMEVLGQPQERQPNVLRYACGGGPVDEPVGFVIENGSVARIVFDYYVD